MEESCIPETYFTRFFPEVSWNDGSTQKWREVAQKWRKAAKYWKILERTNNSQGLVPVSFFE